jgi:hypothetical protein
MLFEHRYLAHQRLLKFICTDADQELVKGNGLFNSARAESRSNTD